MKKIVFITLALAACGKAAPDAPIRDVRPTKLERGEMACYVVGDGGTNAYRARFRTGSFNAMGMIRDKSRGLMVADLVALIASLDVVAPEIDR